MKPIKMFGLATIAALTAMAFVGASSAMAEGTALCTADSVFGGVTGTCAGTKISHVHETTLAGHKALLHTSSLDIECDVLFLGVVTNATSLSAGGTEKLVIQGLNAKGESKSEAFVYSNCTNGCTALEEEEQSGPATIKVLREGHETAEMTGKGLVHVKCGTTINCTYNGVGLKGTGHGPLLSTETNGDVTITKQSTNREGPIFTLCPSLAELTITTTPLTQVTYLSE